MNNKNPAPVGVWRNRCKQAAASTSVLLVLAMASPSALAQAIVAGFNTSTLAPNDDGSTPAVPLGFTLDFFGLPFSTAFVNNNGNITFGAPLGTFTPFDLTSTNAQIIAPFFADVDTRSSGNPVTYGQGTFQGRPAFGATYSLVDYYFSTAGRTNQNSFQVILVDRSDVSLGDFNLVFNYDSIRWEAGTASGGDASGLGGDTARAGYSNGSGLANTFLELTGSAVDGALLDGGPNALVTGALNSNVPGRYIFFARNGDIGAGTPITCGDWFNEIGSWDLGGATCGNLASAMPGVSYQSVSFGDVLTDFEIDVEMMAIRSTSPTAANTLLVRGAPTPYQNAQQWWNQGIAFNITTDGRYSIFRYDGTRKPKPLQAWTTTATPNLINGSGQSNVLRVTAAGGTLEFSINGVVVRTLLNIPLLSGQVGIGMVRSGPTTGNVVTDEKLRIVSAVIGGGTPVQQRDSRGQVVMRESTAQHRLNDSANSSQRESDPFFAPTLRNDRKN